MRNTLEKAKIFMNGKSQAVRLPRPFRFKGKEVYIKKMGQVVQLIPKDNPWESLISSLDQFTEDFMPQRFQPELQKRRPWLK